MAVRIYLVLPGLLMFFTTTVDTFAQQHSVTYNLCSASHIALASGSYGTITSPGYPGSTPDLSPTASLCRLTLQVEPGYRIVLNFTNIEVPTCSTPLPEHGSCLNNCDHIYYHEPAYVEETHGYIFKPGSGLTTTTRHLYLVYCLTTKNNGQVRRFSFDFQVVEHKLYFTSPSGGIGTFSSPNFPKGYTRNEEIYRYLIHNPNGFIRLWFDDWSLAPNSNITVYFNNHTDTEHYLQRTGSNVRPFVSSSNGFLYVIFSTGSDKLQRNYFGFKAVYEFVDSGFWSGKPYIDCGEYMYGEAGGRIVFDPSRCWKGDIVDCIWVVTRADETEAVKLQIESLNITDGDTMTVRGGVVSDSPVLSTTPGKISTKLQSDSGFYIRWKVKCEPDREFSAVFVSYARARKFDEGGGNVQYACTSSHHFLCSNNLCVDKSLTCDGINHCGDWSDETKCTTPAPTPPYKCSTHYRCHSGEGWYCLEERCDGSFDCYDGSDERNCWQEESTTPMPYISGGINHVHLAAILPVVVFCVIVGVVACIGVSLYTRRKARRARSMRTTEPALTAIANSNGVVCPPSSLMYMEAPPSYDASIQFSPNNNGQINVAYSRSESQDFVPPPPYSPLDPASILSQQCQLPTVSEPSPVPTTPVSSAHRPLYINPISTSGLQAVVCTSSLTTGVYSIPSVPGWPGPHHSVTAPTSPERCQQHNSPTISATQSIHQGNLYSQLATLTANEESPRRSPSRSPTAQSQVERVQAILGIDSHPSESQMQATHQTLPADNANLSSSEELRQSYTLPVPTLGKKRINYANDNGASKEVLGVAAKLHGESQHLKTNTAHSKTKKALNNVDHCSEKTGDSIDHLKESNTLQLDGDHQQNSDNQTVRDAHESCSTSTAVQSLNDGNNYQETVEQAHRGSSFV